MLAIVILEAGCETAPPPQVPMPIPAVREDVGLVLLMRYGLGRRMTTGSVPIYVDNKEIFSVKDWRYTYFWLTPGPHELKAQWSVLEKPMFEGSKFDTSTLKLDVEAGKAYFINYQIVQDTTVPSPLADLVAPFSKSSVISSGLILETHELGRLHISYCTFQENHPR